MRKQSGKKRNTKKVDVQDLPAPNLNSFLHTAGI
jgi:hypothetical protein